MAEVDRLCKVAGSGLTIEEQDAFIRAIKAAGDFHIVTNAENEQ